MTENEGPREEESQPPVVDFAVLVVGPQRGPSPATRQTIVADVRVQDILQRALAELRDHIGEVEGKIITFAPAQPDQPFKMLGDTLSTAADAMRCPCGNQNPNNPGGGGGNPNGP